MVLDRLGSNDPKVQGQFRLFVGVTSTLAGALLTVLMTLALEVRKDLEQIKTSTTQLAERHMAQERRLARVEDSIQDVLQRAARLEGGR